MAGGFQAQCLLCGSPFRGRSDRPNKYCSAACYRSIRRQSEEIKDCLICGQSFRTTKSQGQRYCSQKCKGLGWKKKATRDCATCGRSFEYFSNQKKRKYCSNACYNGPRQHDKWATVNCLACGVSFTFLKREPMRRYCSSFCATHRDREHLPPLPTPAKLEGAYLPHTVKECKQCSSEFLIARHQATRGFCSKPCWYTWRKIHHPPMMGEAICAFCGKTYTFLASTRRTGNTCSRRCSNRQLALWQNGEKHPNWRGGHLEYRGPNWDEQRRQARERDPACVDCGSTPLELGFALSVHHIIPFRVFGPCRYLEANDLLNLVCLCPPCHHAREAECLRRY